MRVFRPDNHLLWMGILMTVAVTLYVGSTYWLDAPPQMAATPSDTSTHARSLRQTPQAEHLGDDAGKAPSRASKPGRGDGQTAALSSASQGKRRVSFAQDHPATTAATAKATAVTGRGAPPAAAPQPTHVYLDVAKQDFLKDPFVGRVVIELYTRDAPMATRNFAELCRDRKYVNSPFHRVIKDFMVQGGDIVNQDGTGTYSIYGGEGSTFEDEAFVHTHDRPGLLSLANSGPNTNGCQFFLTTAPAPHLDGKHVVFGRVVQGMEHVHDIEREVTDPNDRPIRKCYVMNCGLTERPKEAPVAAAEWQPVARSAEQQPLATPPAAQALETYPSHRTPAAAGSQAEPVPFQL